MRDLELEMGTDAILVAYLKDPDIATDFYRALCNVDWMAPKDSTDDEKIMERLRGDPIDTYSCSWRHAGGVIAEIRNTYYNASEDYNDYYCAGHEGNISPLVRECFERMGWKPVEMI